MCIMLNWQKTPSEKVKNKKNNDNICNTVG